MKRKSILFLLIAAAIALSGFAIPSGTVYAAASAPKAIIALSAPFSPDGAATEITRNYSDIISIPTATAAVDGESVPVTLSVKYLGKNGWTDYDLPRSGRLVVGDVVGEDAYRTAAYMVVYGAGEGAAYSELVYTVYVGLDMFVTTAREFVAFAGDELTLPECLPMYTYRENETLKYIDVAAARKILFRPAGSDAESEISAGGSIIPEAGIYTLVFTSPETIEKSGVIYVSGGTLSVSVEIRVYDERTNPLLGGDGIYETSYTVGGTSEIGVGMIGASCDTKIQIEKRGEIYLLYFTIVTAQYMSGLKAYQAGAEIGGLVTLERYENSNLLCTVVFGLCAAQLKNTIGFDVYVTPMSKDVSFTVAPNLEDAYLLRTEPSVTGNAPVIEIGEFELGGSVKIPSATVEFDVPYVLSYAVLKKTANGYETVSVTDGVFERAAGEYVIRYTALYMGGGGKVGAVTKDKELVIPQTDDEPNFWTTAGGTAVIVALSVVCAGLIVTVSVALKKKFGEIV
ncbi:MAG: hypothetical protein LBT20_00155 [Clostridiales bacterium]|jgi:hypothetical protein|nr:hypothetical protein [Clostridiales bacterium]